MKRVISVSLGSSKRNHKVETELFGEKFYIERIGTDGDKEKVIELIKELDGKVDAFGMGGTDLYLRCKDKRYVIRESLEIKRAAKKTPILDGTYLKDTLERRVIEYINQKNIIKLKGKEVLVTSALDRYGMAESFEKAGSIMTYGDLIFALGIPIKIKSYNTLYNVAKVIAPLVVKLPFSMLYPTGSKQNQSLESRFSKYYNEADIIAGDFLYIKRYMPQNMKGKIVITNTVTSKDVEDMKKRGVAILVTTTPELDGRSFGTNVMEAAIVAFLGKNIDKISSDELNRTLDRLNFEPRIEYLKNQRQAL
ncbi:quinate 5-dehydrogenase [Thermohalobacter berrensis]|uniref:Quinate 5-dehydrogenase n=1 Tax=Thermohalobacter berrensis TaxID=99594 RepID=A0A419T8S2_9FIRM|nr:quinate 5-dehydrogenase [Thermohalobacter berrensis]RKD33865.1 quinate 5-dehydrogenase [Thermohalobacter berrensis]